MTTSSKALGEVCADVRPGDADDAVQGVAPEHVAAPATVEEASELMRVAAEHGLAVVARGAGTRMDWGAPPRRCDLLVDTRGLDRVIEHAAGDLVVKVEAGLPLHRLSETLEASGQRLALDLPLEGSTVGGTLATAAAGPLRLRYGTPRDLLIGVTVIRADGAVARAGGKVVKNVAGYDLGKLVTGSYGTLGLIVEAAFRLHPLPRGRAFVTARTAGATAAGEVVRGVLHSAIVPSAIEVDAPADGPVTVGVLVEGSPSGVTARADAAAALLGPGAEVGEAVPSWWGRGLAGEILIELRVKPTDLPRVLDIAAGAEARGSAGSGAWQIALPADAGARRVAEVLEAARDLGHAVVLTAPPELREGLDMWGPVPALGLMRRVKDQFDPEHRLSPGRFAGGIC
ncbi:FAD-binding oxidoreductase [Actinomadura alba]|uniref:FAD-binding oxidoreductase n=1 Tax=Actinomadura alba TaxID=406431 RepID=A0ABR7LH58_9ACTN|nr:FAD-binding oxidoreductase [Actinomadura alba]MBC6464013.1 FAD-binding oxidoreductase [Actinomadura alba]